MIPSLLVSYYLHQVSLPESSRRVVEAPSITRQLSMGSLNVSTQSLLGTATIPPGAQRVPVLRVSLQASCSGPAEVFALNLQRKGLGDRNDIEAVYAMQSGERLSRLRPVSRRNGQVQIPLRQYTLAACKAGIVDIYANFSANAAIAGQHRFELLGVETKSAVSLQKQPARREIVSTSGKTAGSIAIEYLRLYNTIRYGGRRKLARFSLEADSENDHRISSITFTNQGSAKHEDLQNLYIISGRNDRITTIASSLQKDKVRLIFDPPILLKRNQVRTFSLVGDVRSGIRKSIQFLVEEPSDVESVPLRRRSRR